jgi:hypothetical protein
MTGDGVLKDHVAEIQRLRAELEAARRVFLSDEALNQLRAEQEQRRAEAKKQVEGLEETKGVGAAAGELTPAGKDSGGEIEICGECS